MKTLQYNIGQHVFFIDKRAQLNDVTDTEGIIVHNFIGEDDEEHVVVKVLGSNKVKYRVLHSEEISDKKYGMTKGQEKLKDPKHALKIAIDAGICNTDGTLRIIYGGEYNLEGTTKVYPNDTSFF